MMTFGKYRLDGVEHACAPVGERCLHCDEPIDAADAGVIMPYVAESGSMLRALHYECNVRTIVGSVAHQLGRCSCYGGTEEDPPELSRRDAARAAAALAHGKGKGWSREP